MTQPVMTVDDVGRFRLVTFEIPGGVCTPPEFAAAVGTIERALSGSRVVLINGRGPVWGYGMLVHAAHATPAVATFDPRLAGYVVVASHDPGLALGHVIQPPEQAPLAPDDPAG
jgi:CRISPR-associated protein Csx3